MRKYILVAATSLMFIACKPAQRITPTEVANKLGPNPHFIIDGQASDKSTMLTMNAENVALLTAYYGKDATRRYGDKAKDGAVEIETMEYAKEKYQKVLKEASTEYKSRLESDGSDNGFQYILNGKVLTEEYTRDLATLSSDLLKGVNIIGSEELSSNYGITEKKIGVIITAKPPKNLYNGKEKFNKK